MEDFTIRPLSTQNHYYAIYINTVYGVSRIENSGMIYATLKRNYNIEIAELDAIMAKYSNTSYGTLDKIEELKEDLINLAVMKKLVK